MAGIRSVCSYTLWTLFYLLNAGIRIAAEDILTQVPEYIIPCRRSDPQIDHCIKRSFQHMRPYLSRGLGDIGVPPLEPLLIDEMVMENNVGPIRVKAVFSNITVMGPSNYTVTKIRSDISKLRIDMGLTLPRIEITGKYDVSGQVLLFPIKSTGDFWAAFIDVVAIAKIFGKEVDRQGVKFMHADKLLVDFKLQKSRFKVRDTVNFGSVIGEAMNQFLNNNAAEIIDEMRPAASVSIAKHFQNFLNAAFTKVPINLWLQP